MMGAGPPAHPGYYQQQQTQRQLQQAGGWPGVPPPREAYPVPLETGRVGQRLMTTNDPLRGLPYDANGGTGTLNAREVPMADDNERNAEDEKALASLVAAGVVSVAHTSAGGTTMAPGSRAPGSRGDNDDSIERKRRARILVAPPAAIIGPPAREHPGVLEALCGSAARTALGRVVVPPARLVGPIPARSLARAEGRLRMEAWGLKIGRRPDYPAASVDALERRLARAEEIRAMGHVKPPGDRQLGLDDLLGPSAAEDALLWPDSTYAADGGDVEAGGNRRDGGGGCGTSLAALRERADARDVAPAEFFDENGVMHQAPCPLRRWGPGDAGSLFALQATAPPDAPYRLLDLSPPSLPGGPTAAQGGSVGGPTPHEQFRRYMLRLEIGRVELRAHPGMAREDWLAAHLRALGRDFALRREVGLEEYLADRLCALEEALLEARGTLFAAASAPSSHDGDERARRLASRLAELEGEVAEARRALQGEATQAARTSAAMVALFSELQMERARAGYALTTLELRVEERPALEPAVRAGDGPGDAARRRAELDVRLAVAEMDEIAGLERAPARFFDTLPGCSGPGPQSRVAATPSGKLRRVESCVAAHEARRAALTADLARVRAILAKDDTEEEDPRDRAELERLELALAELGKVPRLTPRDPDAQARAEARAAAKVAKDGPYRVHRPRRLEPVLFESMASSHASAAIRDASLTKLRVQVRLLVGGRPVAITEPRPLGPHFSVDFDEHLALQLVRWPENCRVQVTVKGPGAQTRGVFGEARVLVPGAGGTPPADAGPLPCAIAGRTPFLVKWDTTLPDAARAVGAGADAGWTSFRGSGGAIHGAQVMPGAKGGSMLTPAGACYVRCEWVPTEQPRATISAIPRRADIAPDADDSEDSGLLDASAIGISGGGANARLVPPAPPPAVHDSRSGYHAQVQLMRWLAGSGRDPNDPRMADLAELGRHHRALEGSTTAAFGAVDGVGALRLGPPAEIALGRVTAAAARRLRALRLRWEGESSSGKAAGITIPLAEAGILELDVNKLLRRAGLPEADARRRLAEDLDLADREREIAIRRAHNAPSLQILRERGTAIRAFAHAVLQAAVTGRDDRGTGTGVVTDDVITQPQLAAKDGPGLGAILADAFQPRRKLRAPVRRVRPTTHSVPHDLAITIAVQTCERLPARQSAVDLLAAQGLTLRGYHGGTVGGLQGGNSQSLLSPFVEVLFGDSAARSRSQEGASTAFNEVLSLPVPPPESGEKHTPRSLWLMDDPITINFFDELAVSQVAGLRVRPGADTSKYKPTSDAPTTTVSMERRFLGSIRVPFSSVFKAGSLRGTMRVNVPAVILGYAASPDGPTTCQIHITVTPDCPRPEIEPDVLRPGEDSAVQSRVINWQADAAARTSSRPGGTCLAEAMVADIAGTATLCTRYLTPLRLPPALELRIGSVIAPTASLEEEAAALRRIAAFVASVPFVEDDNLTGNSRDDVWTTAADMIRLGAGDHEEHACFLACLFQRFGREAFVVSGTSTFSSTDYFVLTTGMPHDPTRLEPRPGQLRMLAGTGPSRCNPHRLALWNARTGHAVGVQDPSCELRSITTVFSAANVWAAVGASPHPWEMDWDLDNVRWWSPLFGPAFLPRKLPTVQLDPEYREHEPAFFEDLSRKLLEEVHEIITDARLDLLSANTWWDGNADKKLRRLLRSAGARLAGDPVPEGEAQPPPGPAYSGVAAAAYNGVEADVIVARGMRAGVSRYPPGSEEAAARENRAALAREFPTFDITGVLLPLAFGDLDSLAEIVLNTDLHMAQGDGLKFGAAVHCAPGGCLFSFPIYIYLAVLRRKGGAIGAGDRR